MVEINEEIEHLYAYLKVLHFKEEIKIHLIIDIKGQAVLKSRVTKLTFQPIVENALKYGFENAQIEAVIGISSYSCDNDLFIQVKDNGKGMSQKIQNKLNNKFKNGISIEGSIGLINVNERIKLNFGSKYGLKIESEEVKFTCVIITATDIGNEFSLLMLMSDI